MSETNGWAAVVAGAGLLLMAVIAPFAHFGVVLDLYVPGDAAATWTGLEARQTALRLALAGYLLVLVADVVVAWALYLFLAPAHRGVSLLAGWFRVVYAAVSAAALLRLVDVLALFDPTTPLSAADRADHALAALSGFLDGWSAAYVFFGLHLVLLGGLVYRARYAPKLLGVLVVIAGLGYLVDAFGKILSAGYSVEVGAFTFVGELLLMLWLLIWGWRVQPPSDSPA